MVENRLAQLEDLAVTFASESRISEVAVNASLDFIEGARSPKVSSNALSCGHRSDRSTTAMASAAAHPLRACAIQVETLRRLRNGGSQFMRVEHVHVNEGGQAVAVNRVERR